MTVRDSDTLKSYFNLSKVITPSNYVDLVDTIFAQSTSGELGEHIHDNRYLQLSIGNIVSAIHTFNPSSYNPPFILGAYAQGQTVIGLKADQLNRNISVSGLGLSGGGILNSDRNISLTSSSNPGASASILASAADGTLSLLRINSDTIGDRSGSNLTLSPAGDLIFNPTGKDVLPTTGYDLNLGSLSKKYLSLHAAELWVGTLVAQDTLATVGGRVLVGPTTELTSDLPIGLGAAYMKHNNLVVDDVVYLEANGNVEFLRVSAGPTGTGPYLYMFARNLDGSGENNWYAGDAVFNTGAPGDGFIDIYSTRGIKEASDVGPTIVGNVRMTTTYNSWLEHWALGNLNGLYGYGTNTYGVALGRYSTVTPYITIDSTNGIRMFNGSYQRFTVSAAGVLAIRDSAGAAVFTFDGSEGAEFTKPLTMASTGGIYQGTGSFASPTTGLKMWNDGGIGRIGGYNSSVLQWYGDTDGKLHAGAGDVTIDVDGITFNAVGGKYSSASLGWWDGAQRELSIGTEVDLSNVVGTYIDSYQDFTITVNHTGSPQVLVAFDIDNTDARFRVSLADIWGARDLRIGKGIYAGDISLNSNPADGTITATNWLKAAGNGASNGVFIGDDTQLYRDGTDVLRIPDNLVVDGKLAINNPSSGLGFTYSQTVTTSSRNFTLQQYSADAVSPIIVFNKSRGTTINSIVNAQADDPLGVILAQGANDAGSWSNAAAIRFHASTGWGGSGDSPGRIEFMTTPDGSGTLLTRAIIDEYGFFGINKPSPISNQLTIGSTSTGSDRHIGLEQYSAEQTGAAIIFRKSRNATLGSHTAVNSNDGLGVVVGGGSDGSAWRYGSMIKFTAAETFSGTSSAGKLEFFTTPIGSTTLTKRASIDEYGSLILEGLLWLKEQSAPSTPSSGYASAYIDTYGYLRVKNDAGMDLPGVVAIMELPVGSGELHSATMTTGGTWAVDAWWFSNTADNYVQWGFRLPSGWAGRTLYFAWAWTRSSAGSGNVRWYLSAGRLADGVALPSAATVTQAQDIAVPSGLDTIQVNYSSISLASWNNDDFISIRFGRDGAHANDTFAANTKAYGLRIWAN